jgi:hypothetical protein
MADNGGTEEQMKKYRFWIISLILLLIGGIVFDQVAAVKPTMPPLREGDPEPPRPTADDEPFSKTPIAANLAERRQMYFDWVLTQPTSDERGGVWTDIVKLEAGAEQINPASFQATLDFVNNREDPSDFYMTALIRLYYLNAGMGKLTPEQEAAIQDAILNWKFWLNEPNTTYVEMWTENHQILNHSIEYLAGQLFPDEVFTNNGQKGIWHLEHARTLLLQWIDLRARTGFAEWDSETYYPEDLAPLLNLVDFADDPEIATLAAMLVDVILFDVAVDSFYGQFATSSGRITAGSIKSADSSMTTIAALAWGQGKFTTTSNMGAVALATSRKYEVPPVIQALALDNPREYLNYERHSFNIEDAASYGMDITNLNDTPRFWGMGAFTLPDVINLTIQTADEWDLWHYPDFKDLKDIAKILQTINGLPLASGLLDPDPNGIYMGEVNKVTYRTPDYMLSSAQSFRPGEKGYQQHIWQATLSPYAVVFVNNPDSLRADDKHRPSYWMANGRQPRTAQVKNVLVALYDISRYKSAPSPLEARHYTFTHAYFPKWAFDEVLEKDGWVFGRVGDGYVALYSQQPYQWVTAGPDANQEIVALGYKNVWICQLGRAEVDDSFQDFITAITQADLKVNKLSVHFDSPGNGMVEFGWSNPLTFNGTEVPLSGYPRFDNPYTQVEFDSPFYHITYKDMSLLLDFEAGIREIK